MFQSALALSGEGNLVRGVRAMTQYGFQSALALSGAGNAGNAGSRPATSTFQSALALSGEGNNILKILQKLFSCFNPPSPFRARGTTTGYLLLSMKE